MRKIIILSKTEQNGFFDVGYVFWLSVPEAQQPMYANSEATSIIKDITSQELQDIKDGKIKETTGVMPFINGTTNAVIGQKLVAIYNTEQTNLNNSTEFNYYGTYWDGSTWTIKGV